MQSLRELQRDFAGAVFGGADAVPSFGLAGAVSAAERIAIYRNAVYANYRNALHATYPVIERLVGVPFFNAAVDAFVQAHPSTSGDLNVYGDRFADFLLDYPHALHLPWLPDVARVEWAIDEAQRAADTVRDPEAVLAALASAPPQRLPRVRLRLDASCRLLVSDYPVWRIWQSNQPGYAGEEHVALDQGEDRLLVRRDADGVALLRVAAGEHAFLTALADGATLGAAIDAATNATKANDDGFDLGAVLRAAIAAGTIAAVDIG